jgi:hypothetical protein
MNQENKKRIIVVLGMHRSGTSAVTRGLQTLGVDLGSNLMPPVPGNNEKGFYEDVEINRLNIELLNALESDWDALSFIPAAAFEQENLAPFKLRAIELMRSKMGGQPFGLKDPRMAQLLPFWRAVFNLLNVSVAYVIAVRHPMSVMRSLQTRDGFDNEKAYYLWLEYVLPTILETVGAGRIVVDFDLLMADPQAQLKRMAHALGLPFNSGSSGVKEYISEFLDEKLQHTRFELEDLRVDPAVPLDVIKAYEALDRLAREDINIDAQEVGELFWQLSSRMRALSPALNYMTRLDRKVAAHDGQFASLSQEIATKEIHIHNLDAIINNRDENIANLNQAVTERDGQFASLSQAVDEKDTYISNLDEFIAERDGRIASLSQAVAERDGRIASLSQAVAERDDKVVQMWFTLQG